MPHQSVVSPSRLTSPAGSLAAVMLSENRLIRQLPAGAFQVWPAYENAGPVTAVIMARQEPSLSSNGSVAVTQSTIFRWPVVVFCSAGWSMSTPESMMPMVTPRPSQVGCFFLNSTEPVSLVGRYGFAAGVVAPGPAGGAACLAACSPVLPRSGSGSLIVSSRSTAEMPGSFAV